MKKTENKQVLYLGRWVDSENFRAFVYNVEGKKLAQSYKEYEDLIASGIWFATKDDVPTFVIKRKKRNGADSSGICE